MLQICSYKSKDNKGIRFLLCLIDIFSKYTQVVPLKDKKSVTVTNASQKLLHRFDGRKPSKIWEDKHREFYNNQ